MRTIFLVFLSLLIIHSESYPTSNKPKLKGLEDIYLKVEFVNPKLRKYGITTKILKEDITLQFKDAGIELLPEYQFRTSNYYPVLYVKLSAEVDEDYYDSIPYSILIELREISYLRRDASVITHAVSWEERAWVHIVLIEFMKSEYEFIISSKSLLRFISSQSRIKIRTQNNLGTLAIPPSYILQ